LRRAPRALKRAASLHEGFIRRLKAFRVLDPACGSGNFLYLSLLALKDLEHRANLEAEALGLPRGFPSVGPECVKGIEINPYAAELARVSVWIGEIQWMRRNGFQAARNPILRPLGTIECRDAVLNEDGTRAEWPEADVVVGNPPFLGGKRLLSVVGDEYTTKLRGCYAGAVEPFADLVCYWFKHARQDIEFGRVGAAGLVATNSIRGGASRETLRRILTSAGIFEAWSDEPWVSEGAAVRVSIVCFGSRIGSQRLNGDVATQINADLTGSQFDLSTAATLPANLSVCFEGGQKHGPFELTGREAREVLQSVGNPHGRPNSDVLRTLLNATDIVRARSDTWVILFPDELSEVEAALYERPFLIVSERVKPVSLKSKLQSHRDHWWRHHRTRPALRAALACLRRYIVTPVVAKHRVFAWVATTKRPPHLRQNLRPSRSRSR
jgi:hypothetical protein